MFYNSSSRNIGACNKDHKESKPKKATQNLILVLLCADHHLLDPAGRGRPHSRDEQHPALSGPGLEHVH